MRKKEEVKSKDESGCVREKEKGWEGGERKAMSETGKETNRKGKV